MNLNNKNVSIKNIIVSAIWLIFLICVVFLTSCRRRQITEPTPQMDADQKFWIRVLLDSDINSCSVNIKSPFTIFASGFDPVEVTADKSNQPFRITKTNEGIQIDSYTFDSKEIEISPNEPHIFTFNGSEFRGKIKLIAGVDSLDIINLVPLEPYLAGVVGAEMPSYWEPAALQAQAIASRTYCMYIKRRFGKNRSWDLSRTQSNQVYRGISAESLSVSNAINSTAGEVLVCEKDGKTDIFPAYYSSTCGGHTESSINVFGDSFESLQAVPCPYCKEVAKPKYFFWPIVQYKKDFVTGVLQQNYPSLAKLGDIIEIKPVNPSVYDSFTRLTWLKLTGSTGKSDSIRAEDLRLTIDSSGTKIRSAICRIEDMGDRWAFLSGRGFGHGVGMCQCGAEQLAREGRSKEEILEYYFPQSKIANIYKR